jgi:hypothetical protein
MLMLFAIGHRIARTRLQEDSAPEVSGAVIAALFALLGLLIAFTFSGAYSRLEVRRQLIIQEANAIGTAYLRLDLLPAPAQPPLREKFREYTQSRAALYEKLSDDQAIKSELATAGALQKEIWGKAIEGSKGQEYQSVRILLLPALNEMIDIVNTRTIATQTHTPLHIYFIMFVIALACAGLTGYRAGNFERPGHLYNIMLALITSCILYLILDIEYPSEGLIRLDKVNQVLFEVIRSMK